MALLVPRTDDTLQSRNLVERDPGTDVEDTQHGGMGHIDSQFGLTRDDDDSMDGLLEGVYPVGVELAVDGGAGVTEVLRVSELTTGEGGVANVVVNPQLDGISALASIANSNYCCSLPSKDRNGRRRC